MKISTEKVIWYVVGRFYINSESEAFDAGYFSYIDGLKGPFFQGSDKNESTAFFTFYADKFTSTAIQNGNVSTSLTPPGNWSMYLNHHPDGSWGKPSSFKGSQQQKIATWSRANTSMSTTVGVTSLSLLTFNLKESWDFEWQGKIYNIREIIPHDVTQLGFGSAELLDPLPKYPTIKAFGASAMLNSKDSSE